MPKNQNSNSSPYQWFREGNTPTKKNPMKQFLKIFKILIYVTLLSISLTGCVQSMVIRTSTKTGTGLEFYSSVNNVAPNIKTFNITHEKDSKTKKDFNVFALDAEENYWLKDKENLDLVHNQIDHNGGTFGGHSSSKGGKAWKSKNLAIRFSNGNGSGNKEIVKNGNKVLAVSTTESNYNSFVTKPQTFNVLVPKNEDWSKLIAKSSDVYLAKNWVVKKVTYNPNEIKTSNNDNKSLQKNFTYDSYFTFLQYMKENNINLDTKQFTTPKDTDTITGGNKAWLDSYLTTTLATNWYLDKDAVLKEQKSTNATILGWGSVTESRAVITWSDAWHLGPFYAMFVFPLSKLTIKLIGFLPVWAGWGSVITILILVLVLRTIAYGLSFKSTLQQVKQQEVQAKIAQINAKYEPYKGNRQMENRKKQETFDIYKKEGISPLGAMGSMFVTMPIFLSMWRVIGAIPHLKSTSVAGIVFAEMSYKQVLAGHFQYIVVMLLASSLQAVSILLPRWLSKRRDKHRTNIHQQAALKKQNKTQTIMAIVFAVIAAALPAGVSIYMMFSALYQIGQNSLNHKIIKWQKIKSKRLKGLV